MKLKARRDFIQVFVTCPRCGRVWFKRLYSTGEVRLVPADGVWDEGHKWCRKYAGASQEFSLTERKF